MNKYELISPKTNQPCGVFVCGECNIVRPKDLVDQCCLPCNCGKPSRNRFEAKCSDCAHVEYAQRRAKQLEEAELVEWDGESMIFSEEVSGHRDGWFDSPDDLIEYTEGEGDDSCPEFAFLGRKSVKKLDLYRAIEQMTEDTYDGAELNVPLEDMSPLIAEIAMFNAKYAVTYYEHDYKRKVRVRS